MSDKNDDVKRRVAEADRVLNDCRQRQIAPIEALEKVVKDDQQKRDQ